MNVELCMAKLSFKYGAMNSGKSDTLIKTAYNYTERGLNIATIKPSIDTKGEEYIIARGGTSRKVDILADSETNIRTEVHRFIGEQALKALHCVLIDESQFLDEVQIDQLLSLAKKDEISVIAFGLRTDFQTHLFPGSRRLLEVADNIEKLSTMCRCGRQAELNIRIVDGQYQFVGEQVAIDGEGTVTYDSLCANCFADESGALLEEN